MVGGSAVVRVAEAVFPVPPLVDDTGPLTLLNTPAVLEVTCTLTMQLLLTGTDPPVRVTMFDPAVAPAVPAHVFVMPFGVATTIPAGTAGNASVNATPVSATVFAAGLVMVKVKVEVPFNGM